MPILEAEVSVNPAELFSNGVDRVDREWWVLHTKPRQEKALARQLVQLNVPFYLPLVENKSVIRGKLIKSYIPAFTSYVFMLGDGSERLKAISTRHVVRSIEVIDQLLLEQDLNQINRLISSGLTLSPEKKFTAGDMVEITSGPLAGLRGPVIKEASGNRFVVRVHFIQQGVSVLINDYALSAASGDNAA